jgi:WD40 repeat protein
VNRTAQEALLSHDAPVVGLDWSVDGMYLQSVCENNELLFHAIDMDYGSNQVRNPEDVRQANWATQTCRLGWSVDGLHPIPLIAADVTAVCRGSFTRSADLDYHIKDELLLSGLSTGILQLTRYPCLTNAQERYTYAGHGGPVTAVAFSDDGTRAFSAGGADKIVIQWKVLRPPVVAPVPAAAKVRNTL